MEEENSSHYPRTRYGTEVNEYCSFHCNDCNRAILRLVAQQDRDQWTKVYRCKTTTKHKSHTHPDDRNAKCSGRSYDMT